CPYLSTLNHQLSTSVQPHRLRQSLRRWHSGFPPPDRTVPGYRRLKSVAGIELRLPSERSNWLASINRGRTLLTYANYAVIHHAGFDAGSELSLDCFHRSRVGKNGR